MSKLCLVTGSSGLIGSEVAAFFHGRGFAVHGVDNNQREVFFGPQGNTRWNQARLQKALPGFAHHEVDMQEYGRYFGLPTCCLRGGCLTGPNHSGVELHGFLSYLVKCNLEGREYRIYGYKGKQVRDNIHSADVAGFMYEFYQAPRAGEVYNLGGGKENSCSILEAFQMAEACTGRKQIHTYLDQARSGDHICYYSDLRKMRSHYPQWRLSRSLPQIFEEITASWRQRLL